MGFRPRICIHGAGCLHRSPEAVGSVVVYRMTHLSCSELLPEVFHLSLVVSSILARLLRYNGMQG